MACELVTGHAGSGHVSSADAGRFNAGLLGPGKYVLNTGEQFAASIESANLIRIASGDAVNQGRHIIIPQNTYVDAALQNGTQGKKRIDVITLRYTKTQTVVDDASVTIESAEVHVIKGIEVSTSSTPVAPAATSGDIFDGASADDMPLYHVLITNTSVTSVTPVFTVVDNLVDVQGDVADNAADLIQVHNSVNTLTSGLQTANTNISNLQTALSTAITNLTAAINTAKTNLTNTINTTKTNLETAIAALISDTSSATNKTWSAKKIKTELATRDANLADAMTWKVMGTDTDVKGSTNVLVPAAAHEVFVSVFINWEPTRKVCVDFIVPVNDRLLTDKCQHVNYWGKDNNGFVRIVALTSGGNRYVKLDAAYNGTTSVISYTYCRFYYR